MAKVVWESQPLNAAAETRNNTISITIDEWVTEDDDGKKVSDPYFQIRVPDVLMIEAKEYSELVRALMDTAMVIEAMKNTPELFRKGCTCRALPDWELQVVHIAGEDACKIHGFGTP